MDVRGEGRDSEGGQREGMLVCGEPQWKEGCKGVRRGCVREEEMVKA